MKPALRHTLPVSPTFGPAIVQAQERGGMFAVFMLGLYMFSGNATDIMEMSIGAKPYLSTVAGLVVFLLFLVSGRVLRALNTASGKLWLLMMVWLVIDVPFSYWPGGSQELLRGYIPKAHMVLFYICALTPTLKDCGRLIFAMVMPSAALLFECIRFGSTDIGGRFCIPDSMLFSNPNDTGIGLVVSIGLFVFLILSKGWVAKACGITGFLLAVYFALKTGSRGSFLACGVMAAFCLIFTHYRVKVILLSVPVIVIMLTLSGDTLHRLTLILLKPGEASAAVTLQDRASIESQLERQDLLQASVEYMFAHPIFGIGPGQFSDFRWAQMRQAGTHVASLGTHNSYTQIGSEGGFIPLFCFAGVIILSIRSNYRIYRYCKRHPEFHLAENMALSLLMACLGYGVNAFFHHSAYSPYVSILGGASCVLAMAARPIMQPARPQLVTRAGSLQ